jgi:glucose/arabinose dehydrogenase
MRAVIGVLALAVAMLVSPAPAAALPPGFQNSVVLGGLTQPTDIAFAPDGRLFVAEKSGLIIGFGMLCAASAMRRPSPPQNKTTHMTPRFRSLAAGNGPRPTWRPTAARRLRCSI